MEETIKITDNQIFTKIWTSPRLVIRYLHENRYDKFSNTLLILSGISKSFDRASHQNMGDDMSLGAIIALCIIVGGLLGWLGLYIYSALLRWTGEWLNGQGSRDSILRMLSHAMIPSILAMLILIPQMVLFGKGIFQSDIDMYQYGSFSMIFYYSTLFIKVILGIWTIVIFVIGISEVQKLSIWKSILNLVLPALVIGGPLIVFALLYRWIFV